MVVRGRVTDLDGEPVSGVTVWSISASGMQVLPEAGLVTDRIATTLRERALGTSTTTSADGTYRFRLAAGVNDSFRLAFEPPGDGHAWTFSGGATHLLDAEEIAVAGAVTHDVVMPTAGSLRGRLTDPSGTGPQGRWTVAAVRADAENPRVVAQVAVDSGGWILQGLAPGRYWVRASNSGVGEVYHPAAPRLADAGVVEVVAGERVEGVDVEVREPGRATGRVLDRRGRAQADVDVFLVRTVPIGERNARSRVVATTRTDARGRWRATAPTGEYQVHLHAGPRSCFAVVGKPFRVEAGVGATYDLTTERRARISGRVALPDGIPYAGVSVRAESVRPTDRCTPWLPDVQRARGFFELTGLPVGRYQLDFVDPNGMALRSVGPRGHSPERFSVRRGTAVDDLDVRLERTVPGA